MTDYASMSYWDERYSSENTTFDWYQDFPTLSPYILPYLKIAEDFEILIPGCGNSSTIVNIYIFLIVHCLVYQVYMSPYNFIFVL